LATIAAFAAAALLGAFLAFRGDGKETAPAEAAASLEPAVEPPAEPAPVPPAPPPEPPPEPTPEPPKGPELAAAGELPPHGPAGELPDLIEVDGKTYHPVRLRSFGGDKVEALGADGRIYSIAAARVTKIEDRADLARRIGVERRRLEPKDVPARVALAEWCAARTLLDEARSLVRDALSLEPEDAAARALKARLEEAR
jgi:hypothetical protein